MYPLVKGPAKLVWRVLILVVGLIVLVAGIIMIVTPGPAVVFIPLGLGILATEFQWARRILQRVRPMVDAAIARAKEAKEARARKKAARREPHSTTPADA